MHQSDFFRHRYWWLGFDTWYRSDTVVELLINCIPVLEKYLRDGREYLGCMYSSGRWKPSSSTTDTGWASQTMNSQTFCVIANALKLSIGNFLHRWSASAKVSCWALLSSSGSVAVDLFGMASVKYFCTADSLAYCMLLNSCMRHVLGTNDVVCAAMEGKKMDLFIFLTLDPAILSISGPISDLNMGSVHP